METVKAAIWARVSTTDQHTENQLDVLREWAARRGLEVVREFVTEDSAWQNGNGTKGKEFDKTRDELINDARLGHHSVTLVWAVDRLSRRGIEDTLATMRRLYECGGDIWSHQEPWLVTSEPRMRELLVSFMAWMAEQESARRSERIKAGLARRRRDIEAGKIEGTIGGSKKGRKLKKGHGAAGARARWSDPAQHEALAERNRQRAAAP